MRKGITASFVLAAAIGSVLFGADAAPLLQLAAEESGGKRPVRQLVDDEGGGKRPVLQLAAEESGGKRPVLT